MSFFTPNTWYPIADFPADWKGKDIEVDLWIPDAIHGYRVADCQWMETKAEPIWLARESPSVPIDLPSHWMRIEGPGA